MSTLVQTGKNAVRAIAGEHGMNALRDARDAFRFNRHLKNGLSVWQRDRQKRTVPPLKFRGGMTWHHGERDDPVLLFRELFIDRFYEPLCAPTNAHIVDIGANIGVMTMWWALGRPDLHFHAYEPNPDSFATLSKNVDVNGLSGQVSLHNEAVGRTAGELDLWVDVRTAFSTAYGKAPFEGARKKAVPMVSLDDVWERIQRKPIWMLKIDTEGAEGDILEGASDAVLGNVTNACIEWHDNIVPGVFARCRDRLEATGFEFHLRKHPWDEGIFYASKRS